LYGQMSLGKCRLGKRHGTVLHICLVFMFGMTQTAKCVGVGLLRYVYFAPKAKYISRTRANFQFWTILIS
jgi:hypothetical protein